MTYNAFKKLVQSKGWTLAQIRFDEKPEQEMVDLLDVLGERKYEQFVMRFESEPFTVGDRVKFREVVDPGDEHARFIVTEDNGDRLFVRLVCDLPIPPVSLVQRADLCKA